MTECLLCKEQIKEKGSFLRLFLLKKKDQAAAPFVIKILNAYLKNIAHAVFAMGNQIYVQIAKNGKEGNQVQHQSLFTYNEAMKNYFSQYKFQGDYALRFVFAKQLKKQSNCLGMLLFRFQSASKNSKKED